MKRFFCIVFIFAIILSAQAQTGDLNFSKMMYGTTRLFAGTRSFALGGSGLAGAEAVHAAWLNPALITGATHQIEASLLGNLNKVEEDRSFPYYDNFGGFVDYGSFVFNDNWYGNAGFSMLAKLPVDFVKNLSVGLAVNSWRDFNYDYVEEVRTTGFSDAILAFNKIKSDGLLRAYSLSLAAEPVEQLSVGLTLSLLSGEITQKAEIDSVDPSMQNIRQVETNTFSPGGSPVEVHLGATYDVNPFLRVAATVKLPVSLELENDYHLQTQDVTLMRALDAYSVVPNQFTAGSGAFDSVSTVKFNRELKYPFSFGVGLQYRFTNVLEAVINADFEYTYWSKFEDNMRSNLHFDDTYAVRVGIEHIFFDRVPFRVGFSYQPLKESRNFTRTIFTIGTGMNFDNFKVDFAGGFSNITYDQRDMYDNGKYPPLVTRADILDRVDSTDLYTALEVKYYFDWQK